MIVLASFSPARLRAHAPALAALANLAQLVLAGPGASQALCAQLSVQGLHGDLITAAHDLSPLPTLSLGGAADSTGGALRRA